MRGLYDRVYRGQTGAPCLQAHRRFPTSPKPIPAAAPQRTLVLNVVHRRATRSPHQSSTAHPHTILFPARRSCPRQHCNHPTIAYISTHPYHHSAGQQDSPSSTPSTPQQAPFWPHRNGPPSRRHPRLGRDCRHHERTAPTRRRRSGPQPGCRPAGWTGRHRRRGRLRRREGASAWQLFGRRRPRGGLVWVELEKLLRSRLTMVASLV